MSKELSITKAAILGFIGGCLGSALTQVIVTYVHLWRK